MKKISKLSVRFLTVLLAVTMVCTIVFPAAATETPDQVPPSVAETESSAEPSADPSEAPTEESSPESSEESSADSSEEASEEPTVEPTEEPTEEPSEESSQEPSVEPSAEPSVEPTVAPLKRSDTKILLGTTEILSDTYYQIEYVGGGEDSIIEVGTKDDHNLFFNSTESILYLSSGMAYYTNSDVGLTLPDDSSITILSENGQIDIRGAKTGIKGGNIIFMGTDTAYLNTPNLVVAGNIAVDSGHLKISASTSGCLLTVGGNLSLNGGTMFVLATDGAEPDLWDVAGTVTFADSLKMTYPESGYFVRDAAGSMELYWTNNKTQKDEPYRFQNDGQFYTGQVYIEAGTPPIKVVDAPSPTAAPTASPTAAPTASPTAAPTASPTAAPTANPTLAPTAAPTAGPVVTVRPTETPKVPATGDTDNVLTWVILMLTAFGALALLCVWVWKKRSGYNGKHGA